jgi:hypothetical protein
MFDKAGHTPLPPYILSCFFQAKLLCTKGISKAEKKKL